MLESCIVLGFLGIGSLEDVREKQISLWMVYLCCLLGILCHLCFQKHSFLEMLFGMLPGIFLCVVSVLSNGKIGLGDGLALMATGTFLGFYENMSLLVMALWIAGVYGCGLLVLGKKGREIAFIPFLLIAYVGVILP